MKPTSHFFIFFLAAIFPDLDMLGLDLPALERAIATACFCGLPAAISVLMFLDTVFLELPVFNGIIYPL